MKLTLEALASEPIVFEIHDLLTVMRILGELQMEEVLTKVEAKEN